MAADGSIIIEILGDARDITNKLKGIAGGAVKTLTAAIAGAGTAIAGVSTAAVKVGAEFEESMSQVAAVSGATGEEFERLEKKAMEMGAKTKFSASEASEAMNYMAMAGWKTEDMLGGIEGIMNLAAASGESLGRTSDIVTDALTAFGLSAEDSGHFADVLAAASSNANTNVSMLGESFKYAAPLAGAMNYSVEDMAVALGLMANAGIKASQAGTTFRSAISQMLKPSEPAALAMERLGLYTDGTVTALENADGTAKSLEETMIILRSAFSGLSETEQSYYAAQIFGTEAMSGMLAIINASSADFVKLSSAIASADGSAMQMSETMQDNLQGDITILKSGLEGLGIALYKTMQGTARGAVQAVTGAVQEISAALTSGGIPEAIEAAGQQVAMFATKIAEQAPAFIDAGISLIGAFLQGVRDNLDGISSAAVDIATSLVDGIFQLLPELSIVPEILIAITQGISEAIPQLATSFASAISELAQSLTEPSTLAGILDAGLQLILALGDGILQAAPILTEALPKVIENAINSISVILPEITSSGIQLISMLASGIISAIPVLVEALPQIAISIVTGILDNLDQIILAGPQVMLALCEGLIGAIPSLIQVVPQLFVALVDAFTSVDWGSIGRNIVDGIKNGISEMWSNLVSWVQNLIQNLISAVKNILSGSFGDSGSVRSTGGSGRSGAAARAAMPAAYSAEDDAAPETIALRSSAPVLMTAQSNLTARLRSAVEAESSRLSARMSVSSGSMGAGRAGAAQVQSAGGQTPNIIVRPNVVIKAEGDLAPLARIFKPALDAEDRRVGVGVT